MPNNKVSETQAQYINEMRQVQQSAEKWKEFLDFAAQAQISKVQDEFEFSTKLIIHAHNPNATDCRQFGEWKTQDGNHVNQGQRGIAVLSRNRNGGQSVTYLFDTSQTAFPKEPESIAIPEEQKESFKSALDRMIDRISNNASFSDEQKRLFRETAEYKLCKQYGLTTNENPERFSGIESLSVREIANIGIALNRCSQDFSSIIERNDFNERNERNNHIQPRNDRTELQGRERRGMDLDDRISESSEEIRLQRGQERVVQAERGTGSVRADDLGSRTEADGSNGQVRQSAAEIHMENSALDGSDNAGQGTGDGHGEAEPPLRGDERESSESDRRDNGEEKAVGGVQGNDEIGQIHSDGAVTGEIQSGSGGRNTSRDGLRNITNETAEPDMVSAVSDLSANEEISEVDLQPEISVEAKKAAITADILKGNDVQGGKQRIEAFYSEQNPNRKDFADFIKKEYGIGGHSGNEIIKFQSHDSTGIAYDFTDGTGIRLSWSEAADIISDLIDRNEYLTAEKIIPNNLDEKSKEQSDTFENAKRSKNGDIILGNTTFRYIPDKTYTKIDKDIAADVAEQLEKQGIKFSGVIKGDTATITVSKPQKEALDSIIADISAPDNGVNLSQSEFIEIASNVLSADKTVSNAHRYSDEQNYRLEINNGIDRVFTEAITNNRDIGYSVSEMSQLWSELQNDSSVKEHIQTVVAENVDITLTANERLTEYINNNTEYLLRPSLAFDEKVAITDEFFNFEKAWHNVDKGIPELAERYRNGDDIRADLAKHLLHGSGSAIENVDGIGNYVTFDFKTDEANVTISSGNVSKAIALEEVGEYYLRYLKDTFREIQLERVSYYPELKDEVDELLTRLDSNKTESINENAVKYAFGKITEEHKYDFTNPTFMYLGHLQNFMIDNNIDDIVVGATSETIQKHYGNAPLTNEYFSPDYTFSKDLPEEYNKYFQEYISMETVADKEKTEIKENLSVENNVSETHTPTVDDLAVGDIILYEGKRREVEQIDENRISLKDLDAPDFGGILLGTSDVYAYNGWQQDMNEKGFEIISKAKTSEKSISFSSLDFEKKIPNEMRWKENSLVEDNTALYWVTQEIFTEADLDKFQAALRDTDIKKAYVIPRDLSGYSFEDDMRNNTPFAVVTKDSISCKDYVDRIKSVYHEDVSKQQEDINEIEKAEPEITLNVGDVIRLAPDKENPTELPERYGVVESISEYRIEIGTYSLNDTAFCLKYGGISCDKKIFAKEHDFEYVGNIDELRKADYEQNREIYEALRNHDIIRLTTAEEPSGDYIVENARKNKVNNLRIEFNEFDGEDFDRGFVLKGDTEKAKDLILVSYGEIPPENMYLSIKADKYTVASIETAEPIAKKEFSEITRDMYQTENPDVLVIKGKGSLAKIDISVNDELWERLAEKGLVRNEDSVDRLIFNTDGNNWNRLVIPDKWGNMTNNIKIEDVLTREELLTAKSVADLVIKPENSIEAVEDNEKAELSNEIVWTPISETEDENGRATSYSTKYNDKFYWISENADGKYDIEADFGHSILSVGEEYSNFPTRYLAEEAFEDYIEEIEKSFVSEKQALVSFEIFGEEFYFKINEKSVDDILKTANTERPLRAFREMGERISEEEYAEIQQSDSFTYSVEMNFDNDTASIYTVNDGKGGISEADRTDSNVTFDTVKISDYSNTPEENIAADNLPETKFTALSEEARTFYELYSSNIPINPPEKTPWGEVNSYRELNKGIFKVNTPSHGGIMIRSDIADKILSPEARKIGFREKGFHCYEEDCDACVPERELLDKGIMQVPDYYTDGAEKYNESINEELQEWHTDYWDKREQAIFNARPEEEQAAITGQMSLFGDIPDLEDFPDFTEEESISDNTVTKPVEKSDFPIQEQSSAEVTVEKPVTYCYVLEHSQDNTTLSTRYSEDISIDDVVSTYLPINFENSPNLQQVSVFEGENEVFVPYNRNKREDLLSKSKSLDLDGTYYLFESGKLFDKAESISSAFDKISEVQRETAEKFAGSPVSLPEFSYIKGSEERIIDRSILQNRETADTIHKKEENPTLKTDYFRITDEHLGEGSKREKFQNNIEAIRTLQLIENEERPATPEEQETMSKYIGWGGLQEAFDENNSEWSKEYSELINLLSEEEYEAARSTVNDAFYTSPVITQAIYEGLSNIGFEGGEILEPSMGVGNFFGTMPDNIRENSNLAGIEIDSISGRIAQKLYPEANIAINGYEKIKLEKGSFDLAVGNVPFGNHGVNDKTKAYKGLLIHDYFFAKSLDSVRSGGVVAFVTSTGTLDKEDTKVRQMLAQKAELMGAVRLPNNAFQKNAGTQTATDIIFLKKREKPLNIGEMPMDKSCDWVHTKENADGLKINSYFADNPDMVLGKLSDNGRFGSIICTPFEGADLKAQLHEAMKNIKGEYIPLEFQQELDERAEDKYLTATPDIENLTYTVVEDKLYYRVDDNLIPLKESEQHGIIADRRKAMCGLGETVRELLQAQVEDRPDKEIKSLQAELTVKYDNFVKKYGRINPIETPNSRNASGVSRKAPNSNVFKNDVRLPLLQSLEKMEDGQFIGKTEIFTERTIRPHKVAEHVETAHEALILSMSEKGRIDFDYMEQLTGFEKNKIIDDLHGDIFPVPELSTEGNTVYQTSDEYLSGNIYKKIVQAEAKISENPEYEKNIAALTEVIPKPLKATEIDMQLGMTWIDTKIIQQFMYETFETPTRFKEYDSGVAQENPNAITVNYSGSGKGSWKIENARLDNSVKSTKNFGTKDLNAYELLEKILNAKSVAVTQVVRDDEGRQKTIILEKETKAAEDKVKQINAAFKKWIFADPERRNELVKTYNEKFNCIRPREYDGSNLNFFGSNPEISLKPHQKNAVAHALFGGNTLFAHQVGAGKTFEMIATAMEGKRLGLHNKSMFVVPNHLTEQIGADFMKLYPNANILVAKSDDFSPQKRRQMCARIATGNFDAVIIGHSQLIKIPLSAKREEEFIRNQINEVVSALSAAEETDSKSYTVKQLEATRKNLRDRLEKLTNGTVKDNAVTFEELGVDKLFVDEAHEFKNLYVSTKMENVSGLSTNADVQKTQDLYMKCQYLDEKTGSKGIVFSTGTPVTNALSEMFTTMKYLQSDLLKETGLDSFDAWAGNFTRKSTEAEISPSGSDWRMKTRLKFTNVPELVTMFKECADIKMADQLNLDVPECEKHIVSVEPTEAQKAVVESLAERAERISKGEVSRTEDNMLVVTGDGRKLGLDQRLYDLNLPDEPQTKLNACVQNVYDIWDKNSDKKSTQLVFCDLGVPQSKEDFKKNGERFDVYADIRSKLIEKGIPEKEIAFIHDAASETEKAKLFAKVRSGDVRVLIGSTQKMGAGTNVQNKLIALHDLDCPWRPADLTQRLGRMVRQGNENDKVDNYRYVTKGTFDAYLYQMVEKKQESIAQIFTSKAIARTCDDIDDMAVDFMQVKMAAVGDDRIRRQMELREDIRSLNMLKNTYLENKYEIEDNIKLLPDKIAKTEKIIEGIAADTKAIKAYVPKKDIDGKEIFEMKIGNTLYTDKKEAAEAFMTAMTNAVIGNPKNPTDIAEYKGFKIAVSYDSFAKSYTGHIKGANRYPFDLGSSESGNLTRIDNAIASVPMRIERYCNELDRIKTELADSQKEVNQPFEHEAELAKKKQELERLTDEINADKVKGEIPPEQPESTVPSNQNAMSVSEQQEQSEKPKNLNIKWKQNDKELRIAYDSSADNKVTAYSDGKEVGHCSVDELVVSKISDNEQKNYPAEITKCVKPLNLAFSSKMAMHIRTFAEKVKSADKETPKRETSLFSRDKIMGDEFKPTSAKTADTPQQHEH